jgi:hypothetical protein
VKNVQAFDFESESGLGLWWDLPGFAAKSGGFLQKGFVILCG